MVNVAGGMDAWERAGLPVRRGPLDPGEGDLAGLRPAGRGRAAPQPRVTLAAADTRAISARACALWAKAQPIRSRMMKLTVPAPAALR